MLCDCFATCGEGLDPTVGWLPPARPIAGEGPGCVLLASSCLGSAASVFLLDRRAVAASIACWDVVKDAC